MINEINKEYTIDQAKTEIGTLKDQNSIDFQEIAIIKQILSEYDDKIKKATNLNNQINSRIKREYEALKNELILSLESLRNDLIINNTNSINQFYSEYNNKFNSLINKNNNLVTEIEVVLQDCKARYNTLNFNMSTINSLKNEISNLTVEFRGIFNQFNAVITKYLEGINDSLTDINGKKFSNLSDRLASDHANLLEKLYLLAYTPYEGNTIVSYETYSSVIKNCVINGQTYNNVLDYDFVGLNTNITVDSNNIITLKGTGSYQNFFFRNNGKFKPSTNYTVFVEVLSGNMNGRIFVSSNESDSNGQSIFSNAQDLKVNTKGIYSFLLTTKSSIANLQLALRSFVDVSATSGESSIRIWVIEGDHTNKAIPYIDGLKSLGEDENNTINLKVSNTNIFDSSRLNNITYIDEIFEGNIITIKALNNTNYANVSYAFTIDEINACRGKNITVSCDSIETNADLSKTLFQVIITSSTGSKQYKGSAPTLLSTSFLIPKDTTALTIGLYASNDTLGKQCTTKFINPQITISDNKHEYILHKNMTYNYPITEPLRSLPNGVYDTFNLYTGKITRKVGVVDLSNVTLSEITNQHLTNTYFFQTPIKFNNYTNFVSNKFGIRSLWSIDNEGIYGNGGKDHIQIRIAKSKLDTSSVSVTQAMYNWLKDNPTFVYYEMVTPIEEYVNVSIQPMSYYDGTFLHLTNKVNGNINCEMATDVNKVLINNTTGINTLSMRMSENEISDLEYELENDFRLTMLELGL